MKWRSPSRQSCWRSLVRNEPTIIRARLCIQPVAASWRIAASTTGKPVRPSRQAASERGVGVPLQGAVARVELDARGLGEVQLHGGEEVAPGELVAVALRRRRAATAPLELQRATGSRSAGRPTGARSARPGRRGARRSARGRRCAASARPRAGRRRRPAGGGPAGAVRGLRSPAPAGTAARPPASGAIAMSRGARSGARRSCARQARRNGVKTLYGPPWRGGDPRQVGHVEARVAAQGDAVALQRRLHAGIARAREAGHVV